MSQRSLLVRDNVRVLEQGIRLLEALPDDAYRRPEPRVASSGIGSHVRHCVDFYERLFQGVGSGRVDYDAREREARVETDRLHALSRLRAIVAALEPMQQAGAVALRVRMDAGGALPDESPWTASSLDRELQGLISHTVHHYALIAVLLRLSGRDPEHGFGVAPSTLRYWEEVGACAP